MTKIKITTTQNIDIEYDLATVFDRMIAWAIDFVVIMAYVLVAVVLATSIFDDGENWAVTAFVTPIGLYHFLMEWLWNGQSIGKKAMGIRVIRMDGSPAHAGNYLMRWIFRIFECSPFFFFGSIGIGSVTLSPNGQRLGDMVAGTGVIKTRRGSALSETIFSKTGEDYEMAFSEVGKLSDRDVRTLRDVLLLYRREGNRKLLNIAANRVCHVLDVVPPGNMDAEMFLRTIIRDYNHSS